MPGGSTGTYLDLILTEIRLAAGGVDYVNRLRAIVPNCPIVVMTAFGDEGVRMDVLRAGATACLSKPIHLAEIEVLCEAAAWQRKSVYDLRRSGHRGVSVTSSGMEWNGVDEMAGSQTGGIARSPFDDPMIAARIEAIRQLAGGVSDRIA